VEDPFELAHDLSRVTDGVTVAVIRHEYVHAYELLVGAADVDIGFAVYEEGADGSVHASRPAPLPTVAATMMAGVEKGDARNYGGLWGDGGGSGSSVGN